VSQAQGPEPVISEDEFDRIAVARTAPREPATAPPPDQTLRPA